MAPTLNWQLIEKDPGDIVVFTRKIKCHYNIPTQNLRIRGYPQLARLWNWRLLCLWGGIYRSKNVYCVYKFHSFQTCCTACRLWITYPALNKHTTLCRVLFESMVPNQSRMLKNPPIIILSSCQSHIKSDPEIGVQFTGQFASVALGRIILAIPSLLAWWCSL